MRRKLSAVILAAGLTVSAFSMGVYAEEAQTGAPEQVTEAVSEAAQAVPESETSGQTGDAAAESEAADQTEAASAEDTVKSILESQLVQISSWTDEQIEQLIGSGDQTSEAVATNWKGVKNELGAFIEVTDAQLNAEGTEITGHAKYEKLDDDTQVAVTYTINSDTQTATMNWEIDYPMSVLLQRAAMNTVMGLGIVFLALLFLSWVIGKLHYISDAFEKKPKTAAPAPAPAPAPVPATPVQEAAAEDLTNDLELVAVITAAIAASEQTSGDGFIVRSIKKANRRNWRRA